MKGMKYSQRKRSSVRLGFTLLFLLCVICLSSCELPGFDGDFRVEEYRYSFEIIPLADGKLRWGMSGEAVKTVLGDPMSVSGPDESTEGCTVYTYGPDISSTFGEADSVLLYFTEQPVDIPYRNVYYQRGLSRIHIVYRELSEKDLMKACRDFYGPCEKYRIASAEEADNKLYFKEAWMAGTLEKEEKEKLFEAWRYGFGTDLGSYYHEKPTKLWQEYISGIKASILETHPEFRRTDPEDGTPAEASVSLSEEDLDRQLLFSLYIRSRGKTELVLSDDYWWFVSAEARTIAADELKMTAKASFASALELEIEGGGQDLVPLECYLMKVSGEKEQFFMAADTAVRTEPWQYLSDKVTQDDLDSLSEMVCRGTFASEAAQLPNGVGFFIDLEYPLRYVDINWTFFKEAGDYRVILIAQRGEHRISLSSSLKILKEDTLPTGLYVRRLHEEERYSDLIDRGISIYSYILGGLADPEIMSSFVRAYQYRVSDGEIILYTGEDAIDAWMTAKEQLRLKHPTPDSFEYNGDLYRLYMDSENMSGGYPSYSSWEEFEKFPLRDEIRAFRQAENKAAGLPAEIEIKLDGKIVTNEEIEVTLLPSEDSAKIVFTVTNLSHNLLSIGRSVRLNFKSSDRSVPLEIVAAIIADYRLLPQDHGEGTLQQLDFDQCCEITIPLEAYVPYRPSGIYTVTKPFIWYDKETSNEGEIVIRFTR